MGMGIGNSGIGRNGNENCVVMEMGGNEMGETTGMGGNGNSKSNSHNL